MSKLTAMKVKTLKEPGRYSDGLGLMLLIKPSGTRTWVLRKQVGGKRRDFGLGAVEGVSLAEAREAAAEMRKQLQNGIDPVEAKRVAKEALEATPTFRVAASTAHAERKSGWRNTKHRAQWLTTLQTYAFPSIGDVPVDKVSGKAVRDLLMPIWLTRPETARRVLQRIATVLDWAHSKELRASEAPIRSIRAGLPRQPKRTNHFASVAYQDVPSLMRKLASTDTAGRLALRFLILTAARSGEVRGATWGEIDLVQKLWTLPADRMKAGREHVVPLSDQALEILAVAQTLRRKATLDQPVFPGLNGKGLSDMTLGKVLRTAIDGEYTVHGFRSSFRVWVAECTSVPGEIAEEALAHTISNKVEAAYRRTNYLSKRCDLMAEWANFVTGTAVGPQAGRP